MTMEDESLTPENILKSFADVGLYPWNKDTARELSQTHCPPPSILKATPQLRKLERIMRNMKAEQQAGQLSLIELEKHMTSDSSKKRPSLSST